MNTAYNKALQTDTTCAGGDTRDATEVVPDADPVLTMKRGLAGAFCGVVLCVSQADAIVTRHDVAEANYRISPPGPSYLVDLPHEGHAVLIADRWLVTVAHAIFHDYTGLSLSIAGRDYTISRVVVHPAYQPPPSQPFEGDSQEMMNFLSGRSDIALIELAEPVVGASPIALYHDNEELGKRVRIFGRGNTGNGIIGEIPGSKAEGILRRCENLISRVLDRWLYYDFDAPASALPLEGMQGSGDSGGPSIVRIDNRDYLLGLSSWDYYEGDLADFEPGLYGAIAVQVRISAYVEWINDVISKVRDAETE